MPKFKLEGLLRKFKKPEQRIRLKGIEKQELYVVRVLKEILDSYDIGNKVRFVAVTNNPQNFLSQLSEQGYAILENTISEYIPKTIETAEKRISEYDSKKPLIKPKKVPHEKKDILDLTGLTD